MKIIFAVSLLLETVNGSLPNPAGFRQQTILTRPAGATQRLPAVMFVQWLSCDPIDVPPDEKRDGMNELVHRIVTRGNVVAFRIEKPGLGKSEGPPCADTDFRTELAGYRAALAALREHPWVDRDRIVLVGMSNGGGILPLVAEGTPVAGYVVVNGWSRTWFEHMLEHLRRNAEARGVAAGEVSKRMQGWAELYADYLLEKKLPGDIVKQKPHLAASWDDEPARQYGRPAAFYHQLQELNLSEAWAKVSAPSLVVWGERDTIMGRADHEHIVALVNANRAGAARLVVIPRMTHGLSVDGAFPEELWREVETWLKAR